MNQRAFSLVELSIVLVILGLLVGGVLAGQSLIRASELRSVTSDYQRFSTAAYAFKDKYFSVPGDMRNATSVWGDDAVYCADAAITNGTPGTCNGDGDGMAMDSASASATGEAFQFWKQLALAGLIEGTYSGIASSGGSNHATIGANVPAARMNGGGWYIRNLTNFAGSPTGYAMDYGNALGFGASAANTVPNSPLLTPAEAWNIDTKLDDGKPGTGKLIARLWDTCTTSTSMSDYTGSYDLSLNTLECPLFFRRLI